MAKKKISENEYDKIVGLYNSGMAQPEIATLYNCSASSISSILKQMHVTTRSGGSQHTQAVVEKWKSMYMNGSTLQEIAREYGTIPATVSKLLKKNGVVIDRYTYHFDEHYFDNINTQDKAYILGLLWADGYNDVSKGSINIQLQEQDKELLLQLNLVTCNERPLRVSRLSEKNSRWQDQYMLTWQSRYTSKLLDEYGMHRNKSLILEFPKWLDCNLYRHFLRGYIDGDGCISLSQNGKFASVSMVGTRMFLNIVKGIFKEELNVDVIVQRDDRARDPICTLRCGTKSGVSKILSWIYLDANIFMKRKYEKYQQFLKFNNNINNSCLN